MYKFWGHCFSYRFVFAWFDAWVPGGATSAINCVKVCSIVVLGQIMSLLMWNHAHCDTSMKFGTVVVHDETNILSRGCHLTYCLIWYLRWHPGRKIFVSSWTTTVPIASFMLVSQCAWLWWESASLKSSYYGNIMCTAILSKHFFCL